MNIGEPWPDLQEAERRVQRMQSKLHQWAKADPGRRFDDLYNLVGDPAFLVVAWSRVRGNKGGRTAGVDGVVPRVIVSGAGEFLGGLRAALKARRFTPTRVREKAIPKASGKLRRLGIPTAADRVVQATLKLVLEPIFEADFKPCSYGFRPRRRAQDAIAEIHFLGSHSYEWVLEADITACLGVASHYPSLLRRASSRPPSGLATSIRRPFRRPVRTWTARSWPRLTRCNTVCRETPSAMVASSIGSQPSGACSTNRPRSWSVTRIRQGAPGVGCSPVMNQSASHRCTVEAATPSSSAARVTVTSSPSGGVAGGW